MRAARQRDDGDGRDGRDADEERSRSVATVPFVASVALAAQREAKADGERLLLRVCALSLVAGLIHGIVTPDHFAEWWGYGVFFIVAAFAQAGYGAIPLFRRMVEDESVLVGWPRSTLRAFLWAGIAGNVATIGLWLVTRTVGIPFFGPEAGKVEAVGFWDAASKLVEIAIVVHIWLLLRALAFEPRRAQRNTEA